ncbi:ATP-dependent acyl-CoA ligase [Amycolatopsis deserti]|uniref:ATP-dependent acyl-CoA ligase n=1 Tax=Amycolatopsis deserti TaxID=185696 RepID=A0ABQ3IE48_9PSEU|nr:AMP-binding protein [Amycolatopsis deserti]GHE80223.1 ATP-dependent acyl-CoA ligase [Amycolatopsis deserti]
MTILPFGDRGLGAILLDQAERTPDAPFLLFESDGSTTTYTYAETVALARRGQSVLAGAGVRSGERFAIATRNRPEFFACWFGAALSGSVIVPVNPGSTADELDFVVGHADCRMVVLEQDADDLAETATLAGVPIIRTGADFDGRSGDEVTAEPVDPRNPLSIMYTSGSTSRPKGVVVTHANYLHAGTVIAENLRMRPADRWLVVLPVFHANAQYYSVMSSLVTGASAAVMERFSASRWAAQARRHKATLGSLFAAPMRMILSQPRDPADADNDLREVCFAQNLTPDELKEFEERYATGLLQMYGMTETIAPPTMNPLDRRRDNATIGTPLSGSRLRVVTEDGVDAAVGEVGELLVGGEPGITLMAGYHDNPEATNAMIRDGWLHTGDIVRVEQDGFLRFHDRARDVIKRGGEVVAAAEVERVVETHPAVAESAAVGIPDDMLDEAFKVVVALRPGHAVTEAELLEHCRTHLASFKVPSVVEFVDALPRTSVGKVRKGLLRANVLTEPQP